MYQIETDKNNKLTTDEITSTYKRIPDKMSNKVKKKIIDNKEVVKQMFVNCRDSCFITLKDYKPHLLTNPKVC